MLIPADPISGLELAIGSTKITASGDFSLSVPVNQTVFAWLVIGFSRTEVYLYPEQELQLNIAPLQEVIPGRNPFLDPPPLRISLISEHPRSLNADITRFNATYGDFLATHAAALRNRGKSTLTDSLNLLISANKPDTTDAYFRTYTFYKLTEIHVFLRQMRSPKAYRLYLEKSNLDFGNIAFSDFFNSFFENYLTAQSKAVTANDLDQCINKVPDLAGLLDSLGKDSLLRNEKIRELVLIKSLQQLYYADKFAPNNILQLLDLMSNTSKFKDLRTIAKNVIIRLTRFDAGGVLPAFSFSGRDGSLVSSFKNPISCLLFFSGNCEICSSEQDLIPALQQKFGDKVKFISICCDEQSYALESYLREHPSYRWEFLSFNGNYTFLSEMEAKSFPTIMLLDGQDKLLQYPASLPSRNLETVLNRLLR